MQRWMRTVGGGALGAMLAMVVISVLPTAEPAQPQPAEEPAPPAGQTYIGAKRCGMCHFEEFAQWNKDRHSKSFGLLPAKYQKDPKCLKCHTTGYGEPSGFRDIRSTPNLAGNTCETCHGPGSRHEEICKPLIETKDFSPAQRQRAKDAIWRMLPDNVCAECHQTKGHKESATPKDLH